MSTVQLKFKKFSYYDYAKLYSFNGTFNLGVGGRGIGKTYGAKKKVTKAALKATRYTEVEVPVTKRGKDTIEKRLTGVSTELFIYLRRYKEELKMAQKTFFADFEHEFPGWDFRTNGAEALASKVEHRELTKRPWVTIGYFIALSVTQAVKSTAFPTVTTIVFDEFILEKGATNYIANEAIVFMNFYSTVDRYKHKTRAILLANSVTITNPYFIEWGISPDDADENGFVISHDGYIVTHFIDDEQFEAEVYETPFGKFIKGTEYAKYAVGNEFKDNNKAMIGKKTTRSKYVMTIEASNGTFSVWHDAFLGVYFCQKSLPKNQKVIVLSPEHMAENKTLMTFADRPLSILRTAYRHDRMRFDTPVSRNAFVEIFKR